MNETFIERLKKSLLLGAQSSAHKIEEAAKTGKTHLDILAEKRRLGRHYAELGREAHMALLEDAMGGFAQRPGIGRLQTQIEEAKKTILDLETRLAEAPSRNKPSF